MKLVSLLIFLSLLVAACGGNGNDASPAVTQAPAPTAAPARLSIANWAAELCAASQTFEDKIVAATGNLADPTTLPLAERVSRGKTVTAALLPAMQDFIDGMSRVNPPASVEAYHLAVIKQVTEQRADRQAALAEADRVTTIAELDALNARSAGVLERTQQDVNAAAAAMPAEAVSALRGVARCGALTD